MSDPREPNARMRALLEGDDDTQLRQIARREVRARMRSLRRLVPADVIEKRSAATCAVVIGMPELSAARVVLAYDAVKNEIDPRAVIDAALAAGKRVALPRVELDGTLGVYAHDGAPLVEDRFGVLAPPADALAVDPAIIDFVLVPALAVDLRGHRLGYGRGYYDRLLPSMPSACSVAMVHPFQLVGELADMPGDVPVSWIATEAGLIPASRP